jgi:thiaminase/transcriptional activator TenA
MVLLLFFLLAPLQAPFTEDLWHSIRDIYARTLQHPFLRGLTDGTLPDSRFRYYLIQDAHYLRAFGQALSVLASKAPREEWAITLNQHAVDALKVERQLHESVLASFGVSKDGVAKTPIAPVNYAYTNHLLVTVERGSFAEGLAAMLPCYWIYWEVGKTLKGKGSPKAEYQRWIDQYSGEEYGKVVNEVLEMMNAEASRLDAARRAPLRRLFTLSARYEYMFWDMAWREEKWAP